MRILFLTAYFPPCDYGWGYMRLCERVADEMHERGHAVAVLTSTYRHGPEAKPYAVHRLLELDPDWHSRKSAALQFLFDRLRRERDSLAHYETVTRHFRPDIVFVWHGHGLSRRMLKLAESQSENVLVYYLANYLPELPDEYWRYWSSKGRSLPSRWAKRTIGRLAISRLRKEGRPIRLDFEHTIHVSEYVRRRLRSAGKVGPDAVTIPNGSDLQALANLHRTPDPEGPLRLIVAGRLSPEKGVHTVISALSLLKASTGLDKVRLILIGDGPKKYLSRIRAQVLENGLQDQVSFMDLVPLDEYRRCLAGQDVLLFPSIWDEPLSTTMVESMAMGLLVIGTNAGGSGEVLRHEETGLVFPPRDSAALAALIQLVREQPERLELLAKRGEAFVREYFAINRMLDRIERHLQSLLRPEEPL